MHQRKYPKSVSRGRAPWIPPAQLGCVSLSPASWTRGCATSPDALRASASVCFGYRTPPGRLNWRGTSVCAPLEVQTRRLEHQMQAPIGGGQGGRSTAQKAGGRRAWLGVSAGVRRSIETGTCFAPPLRGPRRNPASAVSVGRGGARKRSAVFAVLGRKRRKADFATTRFRPPGRVPFGTGQKEPKARLGGQIHRTKGVLQDFSP